MTDRVNAYLKHTGGASLADMVRDLKLTSAQIRKALRELGAHEREYAARWPKRDDPGIVYLGGINRAPKPFKLWHLRTANVVCVEKREAA